MVDKKRIDDYILAKHLDNMFFKMAYKAPSSAEKGKNSDNFIIPGSIFDCILSKENIDKRAKKQKGTSSKTQSTDTSGLRPKLIFIRRISSDETTYQMRQDEPQNGCDSEGLMPKYVSE